MPRQPTEAARAARRRWYEKNKATQIPRSVERQKLYRKRNFDLARAAKAKPCADCKVEYPWYVMQFDHVPERGEKVADISRLVNLPASVAVIEAEIAKCDVVCANCHAARTFREHPDRDARFV